MRSAARAGGVSSGLEQRGPRIIALTEENDEITSPGVVRVRMGSLAARRATWHSDRRWQTQGRVGYRRDLRYTGCVRKPPPPGGRSWTRGYELWLQSSALASGPLYDDPGGVTGGCGEEQGGGVSCVW